MEWAFPPSDSDATVPSSSGLEVTPTRDGLRLANVSDSDLFYRAVDAEVLARVPVP